MTSWSFHRAVAQATGETVRRIRRMGFQLLGPHIQRRCHHPREREHRRRNRRSSSSAVVVTLQSSLTSDDDDGPHPE